MYFGACPSPHLPVSALLTDNSDVMDGAMIILATYCLNFIHPGFLLRKQANGERIKLDSLGA